MPLTYKIDVLHELNCAGYNTGRLRRERLISEGTIQSLRTYKSVNFATLDTVCDLLKINVSDILIHVNDEGIAADGKQYPPPRHRWGRTAEERAIAAARTKPR